TRTSTRLYRKRGRTMAAPSPCWRLGTTSGASIATEQRERKHSPRFPWSYGTFERASTACYDPATVHPALLFVLVVVAFVLLAGLVRPVAPSGTALAAARDGLPRSRSGAPGTSS